MDSTLAEMWWRGKDHTFSGEMGFCGGDGAASWERGRTGCGGADSPAEELQG